MQSYRPGRHRHTKIHALDHSSIHKHGQAWIHAVRQAGQTQTHKDTCIRPFKHTQTRTGMDTCSQTDRADTDQRQTQAGTGTQSDRLPSSPTRRTDTDRWTSQTDKTDRSDGYRPRQ